MTAALPAIGATVGGRYAVTARVGQGAMAAVLEARDVRDGSRVALKILRPEMKAYPAIASRLEREARLAATLMSPHVVRVLDIGSTDDGLPYVAMELLEGRDLSTAIDAGPMPIGLAVHLVRQACDALVEAHARGIVHRDIKPSNLFLTKNTRGEPHIKLLDFGVSKDDEAAEQQLTMADAALGTPLYMSPEQVRSPRDVDERSDVWSLAVVLFELLTARAPFEGQTPTDVASAILATEPVELRALRPEAPAALERVILAALAKDPSARTPTARAFREALAPFDAPPKREPEPSRPPVLAASPARAAGPMKRATLLLAIAAGLTIAFLAVAIVGLAWRRARGDRRPILEALGLTEAPTFADALGRFAPGADWAPCIARGEGAGVTFPALVGGARPGPPDADLDERLRAAPKPALRLAVPWPGEPLGDAVVLHPLTPISQALRRDEAPVIVVTDERTYLGLTGSRALEEIGPEAEAKIKDRLLAATPVWIVAAEGDAPVERLLAALGLLDGARGTVVLAAPGAPASGATAPSDVHACPAKRWRGPGFGSDTRKIDEVVRELQDECARTIPAAAGSSMDVVLRVGEGGEAEACVEGDEGGSVLLRNCVVHGAKLRRFAADGAPGGRVGSFRLLFEGPKVKSRCD